MIGRALTTVFKKSWTFVREMKSFIYKIGKVQFSFAQYSRVFKFLVVFFFNFFSLIFSVFYGDLSLTCTRGLQLHDNVTKSS